MTRILIVDDESDNRVALLRNLKRRKPEWQFWEAHSKAEAMQVLFKHAGTENEIDVVLTDLVMETPLAGMELLKEALEQDENLMVILFTAKESNLDREAAFKSGAFDVVDKNMRGGKANDEIAFRTELACRSRNWRVERDKLYQEKRDLQNRYLDPHVNQMIDQDRELLKLAFRPITICFWDIEGFSSLCNQLKGHSQIISEFMNQYCKLAADVIAEQGGILDKFIGDGVMALFGVPCLACREWEDQGATAAVKAAVVFRKAFLDLRQKLKEKVYADIALYIPVNIKLRGGINTEQALVGNIGENDRVQFTALGGAVNLASRIEGKAQDGKIYITRTTKRRLSKSLDNLLSPEIPITGLKNVDGTYPVFEVEPDFRWD
jgi:class 3 adenylate cyclase